MTPQMGHVRIGVVGIVLSALLLAMPSTARAAEPVRPVVVWSERQAAGDTLPGEVLPAAGSEPARLRVVHQEPTPRLFTLAEITPPPSTEMSYVLRGRVKYTNVTKPGYLELLNHFPEQRVFFTRTLNASGSMGRIEGTSDWRDFDLPFLRGSNPGPEKLVLNLQMEGSGTVEISDVQWSEPASVRVSGPAWWTNAQGGWVGGVGGSVLGIFLGLCVGPLVQRGKARGFVMASLLGISLVCLGLLVTGTVALVQQQPYAVYYPLLLLGALGLALSVVQFQAARRKYHELELQKITALDAD